MKKIFTFILSVILVCTFGLAACSNNSAGKGGTDGKDGVNGIDGINGKDGADGKDGVDGKDGTDGKDGADGIGIQKADINADGELIITYTNSKVVNLGKVVGKDGTNGKDGVDGKDGADGKDGTNGTDGTNGKDGANGTDGLDGTGIKSVTVNADGELVITDTDGKVIYQGKIPSCVHNYSEWTESLEPTCTSIGYNTRKCKLCGLVDYEFEEAFGHVWKKKIVISAPADCTETGDALFVCSVCHATRAEEIQGDHDYVDEVCTVCGRPKPSEGLLYTLNDDGLSYSVHKGDCTDTDIIIADAYNGLPVTGIATRAFQNSKATSITIPDSVTAIGDFAFYQATKLVSVTVCNGVKSIGESAFRNCSALKSITLPDSLTEVGDSLFESCTALERAVIGKGLTAIGTYMFRKCVSLHEINIPANIREIDGRAFEECTSLESVDIPENVISISYGAFSDCSNLKSVNIGKGVVSIAGTNPFGYCGIESLTVDEGNEVFHSSNNCLIETASKKLLLGSANCTIPDDGSVTEIGEYAFFGNMALSSIIIPDSITKIGGYAFELCKSLKTVHIGKSVNSIGNLAFAECSIESLTVDIENKRYHSANNCIIADNVLIQGSSSGIIPDDGSVTRIADYAFYGCSGVESIDIPKCVTFIGDHAFARCTNLKSINIPGSVNTINSSTFSYCTSLTDVNLDYGIKEVCEYAFNSCTSLESVIIPQSVFKIDYRAFYRYPGNLDIVYYAGTEAEWANIKIDTSASLDKSVIYFYSEEAPSAEGNYWHYANGEAVVWE